MKTVKIYRRSVTKGTGCSSYPFKVVNQYSIIYDGNLYENHCENINNSRLKIKFGLALNTRSKKDVERYITLLSKTNVDKEIKKKLQEILDEENKKGRD